MLGHLERIVLDRRLTARRLILGAVHFFSLTLAWRLMFPLDVTAALWSDSLWQHALLGSVGVEHDTWVMDSAPQRPLAEKCW